jgi:hypothetical protein
MGWLPEPVEPGACLTSSIPGGLEVRWEVDSELTPRVAALSSVSLGRDLRNQGPICIIDTIRCARAEDAVAAVSWVHSLASGGRRR